MFEFDIKARISSWYMKRFLGKSSAKNPKPINKEQIATLLHFCYCNAKDLYEEATLLRENGKYPRAFFLCALALEELAKLPIAMNALFIPKDDKEAWIGFWNTFNSHQFKQKAAKDYDKGFLMKRFNPERWKKYYEEQIPDEVPLNEAKLASMYVDSYDGVALRPNKLFKQDNGYIASIFRVVGKRLEGYGELHSTIDKSIGFVEAAFKMPIKLVVDGKDFHEMIPEEFKKRRRR